VLIVVVDTLRADRLPFYGYEGHTSPFLREWAERSIVFERAWSTSSWTAPASASLFTGVYPVQHGVHLGVNAFRLLRRGGAKLELDRVPDALETLPELFQSLGYRTFGVSDNPNVSEAQGFAAGFDRFENFSYAGADRVKVVIASWEAEIAEADPWFVYLHYMDPHQPYHARRPWHRTPSAKDRHTVNGAAYDSEIGWVDAHLREVFGRLAGNTEVEVTASSSTPSSLASRSFCTTPA
jgi:arylsulfatase